MLIPRRILVSALWVLIGLLSSHDLLVYSSPINGGASNTVKHTTPVVLDFNSEKLDERIVMCNRLAGIVRYYVNPDIDLSIAAIRFNGKEFKFVDKNRKVDTILCASPFNNRCTVQFTDDTSKEYLLLDCGIREVGAEDCDAALEQMGACSAKTSSKERRKAPLPPTKEDVKGEEGVKSSVHQAPHASKDTQTGDSAAERPQSRTRRRAPDIPTSAKPATEAGATTQEPSQGPQQTGSHRHPGNHEQQQRALRTAGDAPVSANSGVNAGTDLHGTLGSERGTSSSGARRKSGMESPSIEFIDKSESPLDGVAVGGDVKEESSDGKNPFDEQDAAETVTAEASSSTETLGSNDSQNLRHLIDDITNPKADGKAGAATSEGGTEPSSFNLRQPPNAPAKSANGESNSSPKEKRTYLTFTYGESNPNIIEEEIDGIPCFRATQGNIIKNISIDGKLRSVGFFTSSQTIVCILKDDKKYSIAVGTLDSRGWSTTYLSKNGEHEILRDTTIKNKFSGIDYEKYLQQAVNKNTAKGSSSGFDRFIYNGRNNASLKQLKENSQIYVLEMVEAGYLRNSKEIAFLDVPFSTPDDMSMVYMTDYVYGNKSHLTATFKEKNLLQHVKYVEGTSRGTYTLSEYDNYVDHDLRRTLASFGMKQNSRLNVIDLGQAESGAFLAGFEIEKFGNLTFISTHPGETDTLAILNNHEIMLRKDGSHSIALISTRNAPNVYITSIVNGTVSRINVAPEKNERGHSIVTFS